VEFISINRLALLDTIYQLKVITGKIGAITDLMTNVSSTQNHMNAHMSNLGLLFLDLMDKQKELIDNFVIEMESSHVCTQDQCQLGDE